MPPPLPLDPHPHDPHPTAPFTATTPDRVLCTVLVTIPPPLHPPDPYPHHTMTLHPTNLLDPYQPHDPQPPLPSPPPPGRVLCTVLATIPPPHHPLDPLPPQDPPLLPPSRPRPPPLPPPHHCLHLNQPLAEICVQVWSLFHGRTT